MKIVFKANYLPVLGWIDMSTCAYYEYLAQEVSNGGEIIFNTYKEFKDDELCTFVLFKDYSKKRIYKVVSGKAKYLGLYPDHSAMLTYVFYPEKNIKINRIEYCEHCGVPEVVILKTKKL